MKSGVLKEWMLLHLETERVPLCKWHLWVPPDKAGIETETKETGLWGFAWCVGKSLPSRNLAVVSEEKVRQFSSQHWILLVHNMFIWGESWMSGSCRSRNWLAFRNTLSYVRFSQRDICPSIPPINPCYKLWVAVYFSSFLSLFRVRESITNESMQYLICLTNFHLGQVKMDFIETAHIIGRLKWKSYGPGNPGYEGIIS